MTPAHAAQNPSLPTLTLGTNAYITGTATAGTTLKIANPITNSYAVTQITVFPPASFAFSAGGQAAGTYCAVPVLSGGAVIITCVGLSPGFTDTVTLPTITSSVASPVTAAPPQSTFTTTVIDAGSAPASYPGPTWTVYTVATGTAFTSVVASQTSYIAGSAALTVTATLSTNQPGVPITFKVNTAATSPFTASVSPTSTTTVSGSTSATATTTFSPSDHATDSTTIQATVGASAITAPSQLVTTSPGTPSTLTWTYSGGKFGTGANTYYISGPTNFNTPSVAGAKTMAEISSANLLTVAVSDSFGNTFSSGISFAAGQGITITAPAGVGDFDNGDGAYVNPVTCTAGVTCTAATGTGVIGYNYFQTYQYGITAVLQATITGTYNSAIFSVAASSTNIVTGTQANSYTLSITGTPTYGVGTTITLQAAPSVGTEIDVPVTFNICGQQTGATVCLTTTTGYGGSFPGGIQTGYLVDTSGSNGYATATYTLPTVLSQKGNANATVAAPLTGTPTNTLTVTAIPIAQTVAGAPVGFQVALYWNAAGTQSVKSSLVAGQNIYAAVNLVDQYGNIAQNPAATQLQVQLASSAGSLFATTLYVASGSTNTLTAPSFGPDLFTVPATLSVGTVITLTATGALTTGTKSITIVSPTPTINLKKGSINGPIIASGTTIYSASGAITFYSKANASAGYNPATTTIATVGTKIGTAPWITTLTPNVYASQNTFSLFFPAGLSTLNLNASDNNIVGSAKFGNIGTSGPYNILVDPYLPSFTINTPAAGSGSDTVTVTSTEGDFNTTTFAATYGGTAVPASSISWSGTQTLGSMSTLTATISGLTTGTNTLTVSGKTDAGLSNTASASITITVTFANSVTFTTSAATWGQSGVASGIFVPVTNSWSTSLQLTIYATLKSGTSTYVLVGGETLAAGATGTVFLQDFLVNVPAGTYSVTFSAITTANQAVSAPTTPVSITT